LGVLLLHHLTSVTIGTSVTSIGNYAFQSCTNLTAVYFKGDAPNPSSNVFEYDSNATIYYLPRTSGWYTPFDGLPAVLWNLWNPWPRRATATAALVNGFVVGATVADGGYGYTNTPLVLIQGGGGTGATATAVVSNGVVVGITITDAGFGYTSTPTIYIYSPLGLQIGLMKAVKPSFSDLVLGTSYRLQVSADLNVWTNQGSPFTATNPAMIYPQYWDVDNWNQLYFRLQVSP
jgi:BspA type Leucine rich repeat region (6 copies)